LTKISRFKSGIAVQIKYLPIIFFCLFCVLQTGTSQSAGRYIKEANDFFDHGQYREALQYYKQGGTEHTWDKETRIRVAISSYEINDVDAAIKLLDQLDREVKTGADVFFYLGLAYQSKHMFERAVEYYKNFIRDSKPDDVRRDWVKDEIMRCAAGMSVKYGTQLAYVENLGTALNTFYDEFGPVPSPMFPDRLYFSSSRSDSKGGLKDPANIDDLKYGNYSSDMYFSENQNGIWRAAEPMGDVLNSTRHDVIYGFSPDGQRLYYYTGENPENGHLIIDTFSVERTGSLSGSALGPFNPRAGDRDLFIFSDSIYFFSSKRNGGHGGYDIYFAIRRGGMWSDATNLGSSVNSFYDDVTPFLARNGRTLYYSSNKLTSIGGLDIFQAVFDESTATWSAPTNLGLPINSAGDDAYFQIAQDGLSAYFSSNRKSGYGQRDLYAAYMKEAVEAHLKISYPVTFIQLLPQAALLAENTIDPSSKANQQVKEYFIGDLTYEPNDLVLTPQNLKKLEVIANLLLIYPTLKADFICHDISTGPKSFDLYFSVKKAEQVADYLSRKGVQRDRLYIKGCGAFYPRASVAEGDIANPSIDRLNRRIEVHIYESDGLPISLIYEHPNVPSDLENEHAVRFSAMQPGLIYRVQIAAVSQMFQHDIFNQLTDAMIQWDPDSKKYKYYAGMASDYQDALALRDDLRTQGFGDAFVVAHIAGHRVTQGDVDIYSEEFPDLLKLDVKR
jgi:outer membrane protein OmpA-like peptidoglycan-associated protein